MQRLTGKLGLLLCALCFALQASARPVTLMFVGDVMLGRGVAQALGGAWESAFAELEQVFAQADLVVANLESPLTTAPFVGGRFDLRAPHEAVRALEHAGIGLVSLANNHALDGGEAGLQESLQVLAAADIAVVVHNGVWIGEVAGVRLAVVGYWDERALDLSLIERVRERVDVVIITVHWGLEHYGVTTRQRELAQGFVRAGADLVIGHGPHLLQPLAQLEGAWVAYSLGNFLFDASYPPVSRYGAVLVVTVQAGEIRAVNAVATLSHAGRVYLDPDRKSVV